MGLSEFDYLLLALNVVADLVLMDRRLTLLSAWMWNYAAEYRPYSCKVSHMAMIFSGGTLPWMLWTVLNT